MKRQASACLLFTATALLVVPAAVAAKREFRVHFADHVANAQCPAQAPAGAKCYDLSGRARAAGFGTVRTGPTLDVEVPQDSPACGETTTFGRTLRFRRGAVRVKVTGPRICLYRLYTVRRTFKVLSGTGQFHGAHGSGTVDVAIEQSGAVETWHGVLGAQGLP